MNKELEKKENSVVPSEDLFQGQDTGFEGTDAQTFKTPFVKILQALSPELKRSDPKFIKDAEQGLFCNSATQAIYKELSVIILKVEHALVVWRPERGGFVGRFNKSEESKVVSSKEGLKKWDEEGNEVMDSIEFYCMSVNDPSDVFILPMSTASIKHAKSFATRLRMLKSGGKSVGVSWAGVWNIKTVEESNDRGSWFTIGSTPEFERFITLAERDNMIVPAKEMLKKAVTDYSVVEDSEQTNDSTTTEEF